MKKNLLFLTLVFTTFNLLSKPGHITPNTSQTIQKLKAQRDQALYNLCGELIQLYMPQNAGVISKTTPQENQLKAEIKALQALAKNSNVTKAITKITKSVQKKELQNPTPIIR